MRELKIIYIVHPWEETKYKMMVHKAAESNQQLQDEVVKGTKFLQKPAKKFWDAVEEYIADATFDDAYDNMKIYIDGCDGDITLDEIKTFATISDNYRLALKYVEKGAKVIRAESKEILDKQEQTIIGDFEKTLKRLLAERHSYIADRINTTLEEGDAGILFLGYMHMADDIKPKLNSDIVAEDVFLKQLFVCIKKLRKRMEKMSKKEIEE